LFWKTCSLVRKVEAKKAWFLKRLVPLKKTNTLHWDNRKDDDFRASQELLRPHLSQPQGYTCVNSLKRVSLRKESPWDTLLAQGCLRSCFPRILFTVPSCPGTQRPLQPWPKEARLLLKVSANLGVFMRWC
jgi:hypothetical protein